MKLAQMGISAITFDLDDTLWPCAPVISSAERVFYRWFEEHCPVIAKAHSAAEIQQMRHALVHSQPELANDVTESRRRATRELLLRYQQDPALAEQALDAFWQERQKVECYAEVSDALQELSFHYRLGTLTNGNADLEAIGLDHLFDSTLYATLALPAKPAADMFERAAQELGVAPERILHVGDNAITDIGGARDAGCRTAWINRSDLVYPQDMPPADINITSLDELVALAPPLPGA